MEATLSTRTQLRAQLMAGDVAGATASTDRLYPALFERHPYVRFLLRCQGFIELLRQNEPMQALAYAQAQLAEYESAEADGQSAALRDELRHVIGLIAFAEPASSANGHAHLMADGHREAVADALNGAVLAEHGLPATCAKAPHSSVYKYASVAHQPEGVLMCWMVIR